MPGIAGIVGAASPDECQRLLQTMIGSMRYRREYVSGQHCFPDLGVYAGWVAHPGSFSARQSRSGGRRDAVLLFSGECVQPRASVDASQTADKGVDHLLDTYEAEGSSFVERVNGLFSGLLIDAKRRMALLFNDRYGMERIYFYEKGETTYFASEAKALLSVLPELRSLDSQGVAQFLTFGSTFNGRTLFHNVELLPGGSLWTLRKGAPSKKSRYFRPEDWEAQPVMGEEAFDLEFKQVFTHVIPAYLPAEPRIGISLTGGLDTRMIMACIGRSDMPPVCYTFAGLLGETLDVRLAARVAQTCGLEYQVLRIDTDFLANYECYLDRTVFATDGCAGVLGAHEVYFTALARKLSPIRLTGNFGSEILRSMTTFKPMGLASDLISTDFRQAMGNVVTEAASAEIHPVTNAAFREIPWHLFGAWAAGRSELTSRTPYLDNELVKLAFRAPVDSRNTPRSALKLLNDVNPQLARFPTDRGITPARRGSAWLRRLYCAVTFKLDYLHSEALPDWLSPIDPLLGHLAKIELLGLHKFLPYRGWFRRELADYVSDSIAAASTRGLPYWEHRFLRGVAENHIRGRRNYLREIHAILTLDAVQRLLLQDAPAMERTNPTVLRG